MSTTLITLTLAALLAADADPPRKPNPLAPSLPLLTDEEEDKLDEIIDRFIDVELGRLRGDDARKAVRDFEKLGPEAIPALIRGLNRAAKIEGSCPAVVIAKKLSVMLAATTDKELLEFARENIGAGVGRTRHANVLQDLRVACMIRKAALSRLGSGTPSRPVTTIKPLKSMSTAELAKAAETERGPRLQAVLTELGGRGGNEAVAALGRAAASSDKEIQLLARDLLRRNLANESATVLKDRLKDDLAEVRAAAAAVVGAKGLRLGGELIDLLDDKDGGVRDAAHLALVKLSGGTVDFGPSSVASPTEREEAVKKWREWWKKQGGR